MWSIWLPKMKSSNATFWVIFKHCVFSFKGEICFPIFWIPPFITYVRDPIEIKQSCQQMVGLLNLSQFMENARHPLLHVPKGRTEMDKRPKRHFWLQRLQKLRSEFFKRTLCKCEKKGPFFLLVGQTSISNQITLEGSRTRP